MERPVDGLTDTLIAPAERVEILVPFDGKTLIIPVQNLGYDRGWMGAGAPSGEPQDVMTIEVRGIASNGSLAIPDRLRPIKDLNTPSVTRRFVFDEQMGTGGAGEMTITFLINGKSFELGRIDETTKAGQVELWEIVNPTGMDHPLHIHGTQFQVIESELAGVITSSPYRSWKDTVNVRRKETVRLKVRQDMLGDRMYHCHILEHEHLGMMGMLRVEA